MSVVDVIFCTVLIRGLIITYFITILAYKKNGLGVIDM